MRKGKQSKSQSRAGRTRLVAFPGPKHMVFEIRFFTSHPWQNRQCERLLTVHPDCWVAGGDGLANDICSGDARIQNPAPEQRRHHHQSRIRPSYPEPGAPEPPFRCYGDGGVTQTIVVLLTIFSCCFVSYSYSHVPRFCH